MDESRCSRAEEVRSTLYHERVGGREDVISDGGRQVDGGEGGGEHSQIGAEPCTQRAREALPFGTRGGAGSEKGRAPSTGAETINGTHTATAAADGRPGAHEADARQARAAGHWDTDARPAAAAAAASSDRCCCAALAKANGELEKEVRWWQSEAARWEDAFRCLQQQQQQHAADSRDACRSRSPPPVEGDLKVLEVSLQGPCGGWISQRPSPASGGCRGIFPN